MKEDIVFSLLKDKSFKCRKQFIEEIKKYNVNSNEVYLRIQNYQILKYGSQLYELKDRGSNYEHINSNARSRRSNAGRQRIVYL